MNKNEEKLQARLACWRNGAATVEDVRSLAQDLGAYRYTPGIPVLIELLSHKDEIVRYNAAGSLGSNFIYKPAIGKFLAMLANDPDEDCRSVAASSLASLCHDTKDHAVLTALAKASLEDPDEYVRDSAYCTLLIVNGLSKEEQLSVLLNRPHVDLDRVKSILREISGGDWPSLSG